MKKNYNPIMDLKPVRESFILYAAWYKCISAFSVKSQALAFKAICEYALFNIPIPKVGFSRLEYGSLMSFVPVLDGNRRRYENGQKGAVHGQKGGRPRKEVKQSLITPEGFLGITPNNNDKVNVKVNLDDNSNNPQDFQQTLTDDYIYTLLLPIFFFKNCNAKRELKRFYEYYDRAGWRMTGGDLLDTVEKLTAAADRWKPEDDKPHLPNNFIAVWKKVYLKAPDYLKKDALEITSTVRQQCGITIVCSYMLRKWLMSPEINADVMNLFKSEIAPTYRLELIAPSCS